MSQFRDEVSLHPSRGARFLFERQSMADDGQQAVYRAAIFTPHEHFEYNATMASDGGFALVPNARPAVAELEAKLSAVATLIARGAAKKLAGGLAPWPPRVLRWRGPGR